MKVNKSFFQLVGRFFLISLLPFVFLGAENLMAKDREGYEQRQLKVEMQLDGEPLEDAAKKVSEQTGYQIVLEKEWAKIPVFGSYHDVTIENFFQRVLKGKNISIISIDKESKIIVRLFGDKKMNNLLVISSDSGKANLSGQDEVDPTDGQKISEIREIQAQYEEDLERWKNDPDAEDPMDGQKISEIREIQAQYEEELEQWKDDPNAEDPMDGQKISEIKQIQAENDKKIERLKNDPEAVDPMDGQKLSVIRELQAQNDRELERWRNDPEAVDPESGIKVSVLRAAQEQ